ILVIWTNPYDLFRGTPSLEVITQTFSVLNSEYGIYFYAIYVPFNWLLNVGSLFLLFRFWIKSPAVYRRQRMILALSFLLPFSVDILYIAGISPIPNFNFTLVSPK
ncbi:MAG: hypothetical protein HOA53_01660, partial [Anaerolineae bacterium]|nr:hypothetical protein [Anaerolineae bacterium]